MARGPIKHTCPDIDKCRDSLKSQTKALETTIKDFDDYSINDIKEYITDAIQTIDNATDFLEDIRSSNDTLRTWGAEQEDRANELDDENYKLRQRIESLEDELKEARELA